MENNNTNEMHDELTSTEDGNLSDVCIVINKDEDHQEKERSQSVENDAQNKNDVDSSTEKETGKTAQPIEPVFHVINIDDIDELEGIDSNQNIDKTETIERVYHETSANPEIEPLTKRMPMERTNYKMRPKRSLSVRDHFRRNKEEIKLSTGLSASAPHLSSVESTVATTINSMLRHMLRPMENKMNMKVFGSKRAMKDEQARYNKAGFVIHPTSSFRLCWDIWILLLLMVNIVVLPVTISFFGDGVSTSWKIFYIISDAAFLVDILLNFRTGYLVHDSPNKFVLEPKLIAKRYLKTWFTVDFVSSLPFDHIVEAASHQATGLLGASRVLRILRLVKLLSLLKLLRLSRLVRYVHQYEELLNITRSVMRFINLISIILLVAHWNGCLQFLIPYLEDFPNNSWVSLHNLRNATLGEQYCWSLFKALSHMLCIGYGRHPPQNIPEACVTIFSMMTGATFYALFIAICISVIQQMDSPSRQYKEKIQQVEEYMTYRKLPGPLRDRFLKYYEHRFQGKMFDEEKILGEVSRPLREKVVNYNCRELVRSVPFFTDADADFVSAIITHLKFEVYLVDDEIIREGELGTEMYFLKEGVVEIKINGKKVNELSDGAYFGEICLLTNARRTASVSAATICDVFVLHAEDFRDVVDEFPAIRTMLEKRAEERMYKLGKPVDLSSININSSVPPSPLPQVKLKTCQCDSTLSPFV